MSTVTNIDKLLDVDCVHFPCWHGRRVSTGKRDAIYLLPNTNSK